MHGDHESEMDDALGGRLDERGEVLLALLERLDAPWSLELAADIDARTQ